MFYLFTFPLHFHLCMRVKYKVNMQSKILCKGLESPLISVYFASKMGNRCSSLLKHVQMYMEIQFTREKHRLYNSNKFEKTLKDIQSSSPDIGCLLCQDTASKMSSSSHWGGQSMTNSVIRVWDHCHVDK